MSDARFADAMQRERERLHRERDEILDQQKELENKLTEINHELGAIEAYEAAKTTKVAAPRQQRHGPGASQTSATQLPPEPRPRPRLRSRREALLRVIAEHPAGLSRGEIFVHVGLKG
jgi:hypothetical protein